MTLNGKSGLVIARFICTLFVLNFMMLCVLLRNINVDFTTFCNGKKRCETLNNGAEGSRTPVQVYRHNQIYIHSLSI